jgi:hypothetical protein
MASKRSQPRKGTASRLRADVQQRHHRTSSHLSNLTNVSAGRRLTDATDERQDDMGGAVRVQASGSPVRPTHDEKGLHDRDMGPSFETLALDHRCGHTVVQILWRREDRRHADDCSASAARHLGRFERLFGNSPRMHRSVKSTLAAGDSYLGRSPPPAWRCGALPTTAAVAGSGSDISLRTNSLVPRGLQT